MAANPITQPRSKHIAIDYHFVHDLIANGSLKVAFVPSHFQLADSFTKGVTKPQFIRFHNKLHVVPSIMINLKGVIRNPILFLILDDLLLSFLVYKINICYFHLFPII